MLIFLFWIKNDKIFIAGGKTKKTTGIHYFKYKFKIKQYRSILQNKSYNNNNKIYLFNFFITIFFLSI